MEDIYPGDPIIVNGNWPEPGGWRWWTVFGRVTRAGKTNLLTSWGTTVPRRDRRLTFADFESACGFGCWKSGEESQALAVARQALCEETIAQLPNLLNTNDPFSLIGKRVKMRAQCGCEERIDVQAICIETSARDTIIGGIEQVDDVASVLTKYGRYWNRPLAKLPLNKYSFVKEQGARV